MYLRNSYGHSAGLVCRTPIYYDYLFIYLFSFTARAGSRQQREPITVGPYVPTHPVNFPCGRKPEEDWVRVRVEMNFTGDRTWNLRGERRSPRKI